MTKIFDGRKFARELEKELKKEVGKLKKKGITPKLVSILVGHDGGSKLYLSLKKRAAERIGALVEIYNFSDNTSIEEISKLIQKLNNDKKVHGVMVQLPLPENFTVKDRNELIGLIKKDKDVDGLRKDSPFTTPVTKSVIAALKLAYESVATSDDAHICVVGAKGFEGRKITAALSEMSYAVSGVDRQTKEFKKCISDADVVISATGTEGLITGQMVKDGIVAIDVGSPKGDFDKSVYEKALFITPVPGGIGPMTIAFLLENLVEATKEGN